MLYEDIERLLYANTNQSNEIIAVLSRGSLINVLSRLSYEKILLIYYRLSNQNKNKIFYASPYVRKIINDYEDEHVYLSKVEPALIFVQGTSCKDIVDVLTNPLYQGYARDYVVIVNKVFVFKGIIYVADIFIAHRLKITIEPNKISNIQTIRYDENYSIKDSIISNNALIDVHRIVLTDKYDHVIGLINTDHLSKHHDIYQKNETCQLYVLPRKNLFYFTTIVGANFVGTVFSALITMFEQLNVINIVLMMFVRCITDAILIFLIDDKIHSKKLNFYITYLILVSTFITSIILFCVTSSPFIFVYTLFSMFLILSTAYLALTSVYRKGSNLRTFITLLIPELIVMLSICVLNRTFML